MSSITRPSILFFAAVCSFAQTAVPPPSPSKPVTETLHGVAITDPYRWLEDQNSPATREWIAAQDQVTRAYLNAIPGRDTLRYKLEALMRFDRISMPTVRGDRYFFSR